MIEYAAICLKSGLLLAGLSIALHIFRPRSWVIWVLFSGAALLAFSAGLRDDFLHPWDERYHALVAANAVDDPLAPKLYRQNLSFIDHGPWYRAHIWLHKQPLFTWQMAGAMALFGKNLIAMRLSSVLMMILLTWSIYRSSRLFFPQGAFWVTAMMSGQAWLLLLVSGRQGMDHNDMAFIAWIGVSFWGWAAQQKSPHWKWIVLTGVAAGLAMLTKWLAGSLVLCMWLLQLILSREKHGIQWRKWLGAVLLALLIFLPWQVYSYWQWPEVFLREWEHNRLHISIALEGHDYPWYYHLKVWLKYFSPFCIAFGLALVTLRHKLRQSAFLQSLIGGTFAALAFYSLAQTKLPSYTLILLPGLAFLSAAAWQVLSRRILRLTLGVLLVVLTYQDFRQHYLYHTVNDQQVAQQHYLRQICEAIREEYSNNTVIFNVPSMEYPEVMFYTGFLAYEIVPDQEIMELLSARDYSAVVLWPEGRDEEFLPEGVEIWPVIWPSSEFKKEP